METTYKNNAHAQLNVMKKISMENAIKAQFTLFLVALEVHRKLHAKYFSWKCLI